MITLIQFFYRPLAGVFIFVVILFSTSNIFAASIEELKLQAQKNYIGKGIAKNQAKALELYIQAARQGDIESAYIVGGMYYKGQGTVQRHDEAFKWLYKAAVAGKSTVESQRILGQFFLSGQNIPVNYQKAEQYYKMAAGDGDMQAQSELAYLYFVGKGVKQNYGLAFKWFEKAAMQGWGRAQYNMGLMWYTGQGVEKVDLVMAYAWFNLAASSGNAAAGTAKDFLEDQLGQEELSRAQDISTDLYTKILEEM